MSTKKVTAWRNVLLFKKKNPDKYEHLIHVWVLCVYVRVYARVSIVCIVCVCVRMCVYVLVVCVNLSHIIALLYSSLSSIVNVFQLNFVSIA